MQNYDQIFLKGTLLIQNYILDPFLIDRLKFDLRLYVLITSASPLKLFLFKDGLVRFASLPYELPSRKNLKKLEMHLTNYSINKESKTFVKNVEIGENDKSHKRSFKKFFEILKNEGHDTEKIWRGIKDILLKTFSAGMPFLSHEYKCV